MRFLFAAALALAAATPVSAQPPPGRLDPHARDVARLIGTWTCEGSTPGNTSVEVYAAAADGSISLENRVRASTGRAGVVPETFRYNPTSATWTLTAGANSFFGGLDLHAPPWTEATWTLSGTEIVNDRPRPVRIVYTDLGTLGFRREHQALTGTTWQDDAQLTCRREVVASSAGSPAPAPSGALAAIPAASAVATPARSATTPGGSPTDAPAAAVATPLPAATPPAVASAAPAPKRSDGAWKFTPAIARVTAMPSPAAPSPTPSDAAAPSAHSLAAAGPPAPANGSPAKRRDGAWKFTPPVSSPTPAPQARDRAYDLAGTWNCETIGRDPAVHTYSLERDGTLHLLNRLRLGTQTFEINEVYRYDAAHERWTNDTEQGAYRGVAPRWLGEEWAFEGTATERGRSLPVRMRYGALGPDAFRRDFQKLSGAIWTTYASETCSRGRPRLP